MESSGAPQQPPRTFDATSAAATWQRGAAARAQWLGPATEQMLDLAGVVAGSRVLAVAGGAGEEPIVAARRVGSTGSVLVTDISGAMLQVTAELAQIAGLTSVETRVADAHDLGVEAESCDAAICRLGLMFFGDVAKALSEIRRALRPGGKLAAIVWGTAEANPYLTVPNTVVREARECAGLPVRGSIAHVLAGPGVLTQAFESAGFTEVSSRAVSHVRRFPSARHAAQANLSEFPNTQTAIAELSETDREMVARRVEEGYGQYAGPNGVEIPGEVLLGVGTR